MEINSASLTVGDAIRQTAAPANNAGFTGSFAYLLAGAGGLEFPTRESDASRRTVMAG